jgi:hypothetical protein
MVARKDDPITDAWRDRFTPSAGKCSELLTSISCIACSPSQGHWSDVHSYGLTLDICSSFCTELVNECGSCALNSTATVLDAFSDRTSDFCEYLFPPGSGVVAVVRSHTDECWDDTRGMGRAH